MVFVNLTALASILLIIFNFSLLNIFHITSKSIIQMLNKGKFINVFSESQLSLDNFVQGASWVDYDNDNDEDLLIVGNLIKLYKNNGDSTFSLVDKSGIESNGNISSGIFGDYDNDGCKDLYLTNKSPFNSDQLFHNNCNNTFTDVTEKAGINDRFLGMGAAWADYNNDGFLDIYVANFYYYENEAKVIDPNIFYRNNGDGTFTNVIENTNTFGYSECGITRIALGTKIINGPDKSSFQPVWFDYNNDRHMDLFVANDGNVSPLYKNNGDGTFTEVTKEAGICRLGTNMGVAIGDFNNNGFLDLYTTNYGPNYFWSNNGNGTFTDIAAETKTSDFNSIGWGTSFLDFNNDGYLDLYVANGVAEPKSANPTTRVVTPESRNLGSVQLDRLFQNINGDHFIETSNQNNIIGDYSKYASAVADFDNNGYSDILVLYRPDVKGEKNYISKLYKNKGGTNNWLSIKLVGTKSNRDAVGARITIKTGTVSQIREIINGSSFISQDSIIQMFGLKNNNFVDKIDISWPSGTKQTLENVRVNQKIVIEEK